LRYLTFLVVKVKLIPIVTLLTSPELADLEIVWRNVNGSIVQFRPITGSFESIAFLAIVKSDSTRGAPELSCVELPVIAILLTLVECERGLIIICALFVRKCYSEDHQSEQARCT
jgi:hypothetical protein